MRHWLIALMACVSLSARTPVGPGVAQTPSATANRPPTGLIVGTVTDGDSGSPVNGATVRILGRLPPAPGRPAVQSEVVMTGSDGRFLFRGLPKGTFSLRVDKPGYMPSSYGRRSPGSVGDQSIDLDDGQRVTDAEIKIWQYASISGTVVDEAGEPLVNTTVKTCLRTIVAGRTKWDFASQTGAVYTDDRGVYRNSNLPPGDYVVIVASAAATLPASVQDAWDKAQRDGGTSDLQREVDSSSAVMPSMSGMRAGDFIIGLGRTSMGLSNVYRRPAPGALPPAPNGRLPVYRTTFYPGATSIGEAQVVTIRSGEERTGVDFQLRPVPSARISGTVMGPSGPQAFMGLKLMPVGFDELNIDGGMLNYVTITDARGAFTFLGVAQGRYELRGQRRAPIPPPIPRTASDPPGMMPLPPVPEEPTLWIAMPIAVGDQDVDGVQVTLRTGMRVTGRLEFEGAAPKPPPERVMRMRLDLEPSDGRIAGITAGILGQLTPILGRIDDGARITTYSVPAGKYIITTNNIPDPWTVKSITAAGRDLLTTPLELNDRDVDDLVVTLTDRPTKVSGTVRTADGHGDSTGSVIVFPVDRAARIDMGLQPRRTKSVRATRDGGYSFTGLPAGDYLIVAIPDDAMTNWDDAKALEALASKATRLHVENGSVQRVDLQTIRTR